MIRVLRPLLLSLFLAVGLLWPSGAFAAPPGSGGRVSILLLGLDADVDRAGPPRTDTMILASIDLRARRLVLLSMPRDLWVDIPGYGEGRINTAYYLGESYAARGGGPALAKETVAATLDVPVDYYVAIDFAGFVEAIDAIGGLDLEVPYDITRWAYIDGQDTSVLEIPAGWQHLDGALTLTYVRSRFGSNDYERMRRQQQVLLAARDKALGLQIPVSQYAALLSSVGDTVHTDIPLAKLISLGSLAMRMNSNAITHVVIDESIASTVIRPSGAMVEVPDWDKLHALVDKALEPPAEELPKAGLFTRFIWGW